MKKNVTRLLLSALLFTGISAQAELVHMDWKVDGDALATLDVDTGIEWLKLSETAGRSYNTVSGQLTSDFVGWRLPSESEFQTLLVNMYPSIGNIATNGYVGVVESDYLLWRDTFGSSATDGSANRSFGWYMSDVGTLHYGGNDVNYIHGNDPYVANGFIDSGHANYAVFLVSDGGVTLSSINNPSLNANNPNAPEIVEDVSAPLGLGLLSLAMLGFRTRRQWR
jgi:hypothetical protein